MIKSQEKTSRKRMRSEYAIDDYYDFGSEYAGARPQVGGSSGIHLQFGHYDAMSMGEYFLKEDPYTVDFVKNFGVRDILDQALLETLTAEMEREWDEEYGNDPDVEKPDFVGLAYEQMGEMDHCWDSQLKQDCIDYYLAHKGE